MDGRIGTVKRRQYSKEKISVKRRRITERRNEDGEYDPVGNRRLRERNGS